jgi:hypothetical protein
MSLLLFLTFGFLAFRHLAGWLDDRLQMEALLQEAKHILSLKEQDHGNTKV